MSFAAQISSVIAYNPEMGYYDPSSGDQIDTLSASQMIADQHASGFLIPGIDAGTGTLDGVETGEVSPATNTQNLSAAAQMAATQLGLNRADQSQWLQGDMVRYLQALQAIILANPENFTAASVAVAQHLHIQPDLANDVNGQKLIDPTGIALYIEDAIAGGAQFVSDITPNPVKTGAQAIGDGAQAIANAAIAAAGALNKSSLLLEYAVPIGLGVIFWLGAKSIGKDPGGQAGKFAGAGVKAAAAFA